MIRLGSRNEFIEIEELERLLEPIPNAGDVRVKVTVTLQDFGGSYSGVWLARSSLESFVEQLQAVVETGSGKARLQAMSPGELSLKLRPMDSLGNYGIVVHLGRHQYSGNTYWPTIVSGGFKVELSQLPIFLADFKTLLD